MHTRMYSQCKLSANPFRWFIKMLLETPLTTIALKLVAVYFILFSRLIGFCKDYYGDSIKQSL